MCNMHLLVQDFGELYAYIMYNTYTSVQHSDMPHVNLMFSSLLSRKHWTAARTVGSFSG